MFRPFVYLQAFYDTPKNGSVSLLYKKRLVEEESVNNQFFLSEKQLRAWIYSLYKHKKHAKQRLFNYYPTEYQKKQFYTTREEVRSWCEKFKLQEYQIREDLTVDVATDVDLTHRNLHCFPVRFGIVAGDFNCSKNKLVTLAGAPKRVYGRFDCSMNFLVSLKYGPIYTGEYKCDINYLVDLYGCPRKTEAFNCSHNELTSLFGAPLDVSSHFDCSYNHLEHLSYCPELILGNFTAQYNQLTNLDGLAFSIKGYIDIAYNRLEHLEGLPRVVNGHLFCQGNHLKTLAGAPVLIEGNFDCSSNRLTSLLFGPVKVKQNYYCSLNQLQHLRGAAKDIGQSFECSGNHLLDLEGGPENIEEHFYIFEANLSHIKAIPPIFKGRFEHLVKKQDHCIAPYLDLYVSEVSKFGVERIFRLSLHADEVACVELNDKLQQVLGKKTVKNKIRKI